VTTVEEIDALKSEYVAQVAHDLKAPLGVILGYVGLLEESPGLSEEEREHVGHILHSIGRMDTLIDNLLDLGRIEMGIEAEFRVMDVGAVVREAVANQQRAAIKNRVSLSAQVGDALPAVNGAPPRLGQAVSNLVGNALKFTPAGGSVTVRAGPEGGQAVVRVVDTGPGIPPSMHAKLFQKFSKLGQKETAEHEGNGLGLAIVKLVVDAHRGRVWVESQTGQGSTFAFSLPPWEPPAGKA
jgi:signal transduction histidine kinase